MSRWTIRWLQKIEPHKRLESAAKLFWLTIFLGCFSVIFLCDSWFERILMFISWAAITVTTIDIICTEDVRDKEEETL